LVIGGVDMANMSDDREPECRGFKIFGGRGAAHPAGIFFTGMSGDGFRLGGGAAGEKYFHLFGESGDVFLILSFAADGSAFALAGPKISVGQRFGFGLFQGGRGHQNALAFVAVARPRPLDHDDPQRRMFGRPAGQGSVATGQKLEMAEIGAVETESAVVFQPDKSAWKKFPTALAAFGFLAHLENHDFPGFG